MKLAVLKERRAGEARVAATPETTKKLVGLGLEVSIEAGAGARARISDADYQAAGATIAEDGRVALRDARIVLKVRGPEPSEIAAMEPEAIYVSLLAPYTERGVIEQLAARGVNAFAMEFIPRISRAQSMDVLSSQANLAGYKAVIDAAATFGRAFPMMMTAAGTIAPARAFIMGVGVAGLQAIATARRLGAIVSATDVRPATKEQVESLGASFVAVIDDEFKQAETAAGASVAKGAVAGADVVLTVRRPNPAELSGVNPGALVISIMDPYGNEAAIKSLADAGVTAFAMELMPRITRAQSMDVLSSQANLAGYRAVIDASAEYGRAFPMMMTAAGTVPAARVFIMGVGVAGLQAIATARRLGAVVTATDVRPAAKEQVASLGAKFIAVEDEEFRQAETAAGYAKEM
ncbi:MAG: hypothetical protein JO208_04105, partial [Alphaproteobacteria bacterium]|nr:hypothetical protein [Alphaproteobacteria bacterium]